MKQENVCAVLLHKQAYEEIGEALSPYVKEGRFGRYIYCNSAQQNGSFLDMTFTPEICNGSIKDEMRISVPLNWVMFIASSEHSLPIGFNAE